MRFNGLVLASAVAVLAACGGSGGENAGTDTGAAANTAGGTPATTTAGTPAPVTGTVHTVQMLGDEKGYRYEPVDLTVKVGDGVKWVMISGAPHNVQFENVA